MTRLRIAGSIFVIVVLVQVHATAFGQDPPERQARPSIRVTAEATVTARPDQAEINIGVLTQAQTGQAAATQNAQKQDAVIAELKRLLGTAGDIKTISYSLSPNYRYPKEGGQPTIAGYTASNVVQVKTGDLGQVGKIIDIATQSGANTIQALRFTLKDEQAARAQALREAAAKARSKADALASALNLKIVRVLRVEEGGQPIRPMYEAVESLRAAAAPPTPIEPGTIEVNATVTLTLEIAQ